MVKGKVWLLAVAAVLVPTQAVAAVCFSIGGFTTVVLTPRDVAEGFVGLGGEAVSTCQLANGQPSGESAPLNGMAHLRANGDAHINLFIGGTANCFSISVQGTLLFPSYASGTAVVENAALRTSSSVSLAPAACPILPN